MPRLSGASLLAVASSAVALGPAPALVWPSWLVHHGSSRPLPPVERKAYGGRYLEGRYQTSTRLTDLHRFYGDLVRANGYRVVTSRVTVSQTVKGNLAHPEPYGFVEACRSEDGRPTGPRTCVKASYNGDHLKKPITVTLTVTAKAGLGRR